MKVLPYFVTGVQNAAFCQENGMQATKPTTHFGILYTFDPLPAPRDLWVSYLCTAYGPFRKLLLKFSFNRFNGFTDFFVVVYA